MISKLLLATLVFVLISCTGSRKPIQEHSPGKKADVVTDPSPEGPKSAANTIAAIQDESERLAKAEDYIWNQLPKEDLKIKYSNETQNLITFAVKAWAKKNDVASFNKLVSYMYSDAEVDHRLIEGMLIVESKELIYKSIPTAKDPVFRFKLVLLLNNLLSRNGSPEDTLFIQNQLSQINKETQFKFTNSKESWIKVNRELIERLINTQLEGKVQIAENEFAGANVTRIQREKLLSSFIRLKKPLSQVLSVGALKEVEDYKKNFVKLKTHIPISFERMKVSEITVEKDLGLLVSLLTTDIDTANLENLIKEGLINPTQFASAIQKWVNYDVARVVSKYKEEFHSFQAKRVNFEAAFYFPELNKSLAMTQILSRDRADKLRLLLPAAKILKADELYKRIVDLDIFFKRFFTANSSLLVLKMFGENNVDLTLDIKLNDQTIKKDNLLAVKTANVIPNVLMIFENYYLGELMDQFEFSHNDRMLQKFEVLEGFHDGIQLGLFKELGFEEQDLALNLFLKIAQNRLVQINTTRRGQFQESKVFKLHENLKIKSGSVQWESFKQICEGWKSGKPVSKEFDLEDLIRSLAVGKLANNIESDAATNEAGGSAKHLSLFLYNNEIVKGLETIRSDVTYVTIYFDTLRDSLKEAGIQSEKLDAALVGFKSSFSEYLKEIITYSGTFDDCYFLKRKKEQELIVKVMEYEQKYWAYVLTKLSGNQKLSIGQLAPITYALPTGLSPRSVYENGLLQILPLDFYFRVKQYMEIGITLGSINLPPIDVNTKINFTSKIASQDFYKYATLKPVALGSETPEMKIQRIFAAQGFYGAKADPTGHDFIQWFNASELSVAKFINQLDSLYSMYRISPALKESFNIDLGVGIERLTKTYHNIMYLYHISDSLKNVMELIGMKEYASRDSMVNFGFMLLEQKIAMPFYDHILRNMSKHWFGYFGDDKNFNIVVGNQIITRPGQLLSTKIVLKDLYRYFDDSYVSVFSNKKMDFDRYINRLTQESDVMQKITDYVNHVESSKVEKEFKIRMKTSEELTIPLYTENARDSFQANIIEIKNKTDVIKSIKAKGLTKTSATNTGR